VVIANTATSTRVRVYINLRKLIFYLPDVSVLKRDAIVLSVSYAGISVTTSFRTGKILALVRVRCCACVLSA
jgi:hypothetical protein